MNTEAGKIPQSTPKSYTDIIVLALLVLVFAAAAYYLLQEYFYNVTPAYDAYMGWLSDSASWLLTLIGIDHTAGTANTMNFNDVFYDLVGSSNYINEENAGLLTILILVFALLCWKGSFGRKLMAVLVSVVLLLAANIAIIALGYIIDQQLPLYANLANDWILPILYALLAGGLFVFFTPAEPTD